MIPTKKKQIIYKCIIKHRAKSILNNKTKQQTGTDNLFFCSAFQAPLFADVD